MKAGAATKGMARIGGLAAAALLATTAAGATAQAGSHGPDASGGAKREGQATSASDVKKELIDAGRAIADYTEAQRQEAVRRARFALDDLDQRIAQLETRLERDWSRMSEATREQARETMRALRKERNELAEWYGGLKHGSAKAWEAMKQGFASSWDAMKRSYERARRQFQDEAPKQG